MFLLLFLFLSQHFSLHCNWLPVGMNFFSSSRKMKWVLRGIFPWPINLFSGNLCSTMQEYVCLHSCQLCWPGKEAYHNPYTSTACWGIYQSIGDTHNSFVDAPLDASLAPLDNGCSYLALCFKQFFCIGFWWSRCSGAWLTTCPILKVSIGERPTNQVCHGFNVEVVNWFIAVLIFQSNNFHAKSIEDTWPKWILQCHLWRCTTDIPNMFSAVLCELVLLESKCNVSCLVVFIVPPSSCYSCCSCSSSNGWWTDT